MQAFVAAVEASKCALGCGVLPSPIHRSSSTEDDCDAISCPSRSSNRLSSIRKANLSNGKPTRMLVEPTQFIRLRHTNSSWYGIKKTGRGVQLLEEFVDDNFKPYFTQLCKEADGKSIEIPDGTSKIHLCHEASNLKHRSACEPESTDQQHPPKFARGAVFVRQLTRQTCAFSSLALGLSFLGDTKGFEAVRCRIAVSETTLDRFQYAIDVLSSPDLRYYPKKYEEGGLNPLLDISPYPTLVRLCGTDGGIGHTVTIVGRLIFDSNATSPIDLSLDSLDWCCSTATQCSSFFHVRRAVRFLHDKNPCRSTW